MEILRGGRNVITSHPPEAYSGLLVVPCGGLYVIVPEVGDTIVGLGGEAVYPYETVSGERAEGFVLEPGDRARFTDAQLPAALVEWTIERNGA